MTKRTRPTFSPEFRLESALLVIEQGYTVQEAANAVGVGKSTEWISGFAKYVKSVMVLSLKRHQLHRNNLKLEN